MIITMNKPTEITPKMRFTSKISVLMKLPVSTPSERANGFSPDAVVCPTKIRTKIMKNSSAAPEHPKHPKRSFLGFGGLRTTGGL